MFETDTPSILEELNIFILEVLDLYQYAGSVLFVISGNCWSVSAFSKFSIVKSSFSKIGLTFSKK